ncbi:hypothetical protein GIB67_035196, partial [Kingdonia uniflora]
ILIGRGRHSHGLGARFSDRSLFSFPILVYFYVIIFVLENPLKEDYSSSFLILGECREKENPLKEDYTSSFLIVEECREKCGDLLYMGDPRVGKRGC